MLIQHIGHAEFLIELENGHRIVTDPYDASCGYPIRLLRADTVLVSHHHHDHDAVENVEGAVRVIDSAGIFTPEAGIKVTALEANHDDTGGSQRGKTLLFLLEAEGLRIVHLGDLGCGLTEEQAETLRRPDVLMIPVGGFFTIDGRQARETAAKLGARTVLPMHYKTAFNAGWPISGPESFLEGADEKDVIRECEALRVTSGDLECQPKIVLFKQAETV